MRAATAATLAGLACAGGAVAADVGANDDTGKYAADAGAGFYAQMATLGLKQTVVTVRWQPSDPLGLPERELLDKTVPAAQAAGLGVVFAVYPYPPREIESGIAAPAAFAAWLAQLARSYPQVRQYVVGNEPNQPAFFRPQFGAGGRQLSAARFGALLAAGYDALKSVDPTLVVIGVGLSPRGNDRPTAASNISTSPIRFLAALGRWYRASGRTLPLMDGFSFHPYPNNATDPLVRGYPWPNAGFANLSRVKQALWDAFADTPQPTTVDGLRLYLDEVGWQVDTSGIPHYTGVENVRVTDEPTQAGIYRDLVLQASCDPDIAQLNIFGFYDDPSRAGFQAALHRADGSPRASADAVSSAIAEPTCASAPPPWRPLTATVLGVKPPKILRARPLLEVELAAAEGATAVACVFPGRRTLAAVRAALAARKATSPGCTGGTIAPATGVVVSLTRGSGRVTVAARIAAEANPRRVSTVLRVVG